MATGTREGAGSREVAAWDLPGTRALRSEPQAGSPAEGPPFGTEEGCVARPSRWPGAVWLPHCGRTGEFLGGSQRRRSASAAPRGNRQHRDKPSSISMCVCVSAGWAVHCVVCLRRAACSVSAKMQGSGFVKASNRCMPLLMLLWTVRLLLQSCPWSPARIAACTVCSRRCSGHWSGTILFGFVVVFVRWSLCRTLFFNVL